MSERKIEKVGTEVSQGLVHYTARAFNTLVDRLSPTVPKLTTASEFELLNRYGWELFFTAVHIPGGDTLRDGKGYSMSHGNRAISHGQLVARRGNVLVRIGISYPSVLAIVELTRKTAATLSLEVRVCDFPIESNEKMGPLRELMDSVDLTYPVGLF